MHGLDVQAEVRREVLRGTMYCGQITGANGVTRRWSTLTQSGVVGGISRRLSAAIALRDDRPCVSVGGRFAGEVSGVELREGGVDIVEVEYDVRRDPLVGVDLDDDEQLGVE